MKKYDSPLMTVRETADYLQVHVSTIYRMLRTKSLPAFRIGSDWRFRKADLDEWLRKLSEGGSQVKN